MSVRMTPQAESDLQALPTTMKARMHDVLDRLERWPKVSGAKVLTGEWVGHRRIRSGDWRVVFRVEGSDVTIVRIMHRSKVYDD